MTSAGYFPLDTLYDRFNDFYFGWVLLYLYHKAIKVTENSENRFYHYYIQFKDYNVSDHHVSASLFGLLSDKNVKSIRLIVHHFDGPFFRCTVPASFEFIVST